MPDPYLQGTFPNVSLVMDQYMSDHEDQTINWPGPIDVDNDSNFGIEMDPSDTSAETNTPPSPTPSQLSLTYLDNVNWDAILPPLDTTLPKLGVDEWNRLFPTLIQPADQFTLEAQPLNAVGSLFNFRPDTYAHLNIDPRILYMDRSELSALQEVYEREQSQQNASRTTNVAFQTNIFGENFLGSTSADASWYSLHGTGMDVGTDVGVDDISPTSTPLPYRHNTTDLDVIGDNLSNVPAASPYQFDNITHSIATTDDSDSDHINDEKLDSDNINDSQDTNDDSGMTSTTSDDGSNTSADDTSSSTNTSKQTYTYTSDPYIGRRKACEPCRTSGRPCSKTRLPLEQFVATNDEPCVICLDRASQQSVISTGTGKGTRNGSSDGSNRGIGPAGFDAYAFCHPYASAEYDGWRATSPRFKLGGRAGKGMGLKRVKRVKKVENQSEDNSDAEGEGGGAMKAEGESDED